MTAPTLDPLRLNVAQFAADGQELDGDWAVADLPRLADSECPPDAGSTVPRAVAEPERRVRWHAIGFLKPVGGQDEIWMSLTADADVVLQCQRCLQPLDERVQADRHFRFVPDEATAARLDDELEDEVLELPRSLNLRELVEDEVLLALPLVPRHEVCPDPLPRQFGDVEIVEEEAHPFAALAMLRKDKDGDGGPDIS